MREALKSEVATRQTERRKRGRQRKRESVHRVPAYKKQLATETAHGNHTRPGEAFVQNDHPTKLPQETYYGGGSAMKGQGEAQ